MLRLLFIAFVFAFQTFTSAGAFVICQHADGHVELEWTDAPCCADERKESSSSTELSKPCGDCVDTLFTLPHAENVSSRYCDFHASFVAELHAGMDVCIAGQSREYINLVNSSAQNVCRIHLAALASTVILC